MIRILVLLAGMFWCAGASAATSQVPDFALIDHQGRFHQLSRYADQRAVVVFVYSPECDASKAALPEIVSLQKRFRNSPVRFLVLVPDSGETRAGLADLASTMNAETPFLLDSSQLVSDALEFTHGGEVLVISPVRGDILYRGGVGLYQGDPTQQALAANLPGMSSHLHYVVHSVLRGEPFIDNPSPSQGAPLVLDRIEAVRSRSISYEDDVAPILIDRCAGCHREQGVAPWVMDGHRMVQGWSGMIRETLLTRRMPPGQIDYDYASRYEDVHHISDEEMQILMRWIETGAPRNENADDPLAMLEPSSSDWELGEPDLVIDFPEHRVPASGVLDYVFVPLEIGLTEDKWVSAYAFDVDEKSALHHVIVYTQDARQQRQNASRGGSRTNFGGYAPGRGHIELDPDTGILLKRDMRFMIQFHYTTIGRELTDRTRLGLYFHDAPPEHVLERTAVMNGEFVIPPGIREYPVTASTLIPNDSYLYSFAPHMHYRGKHIRFRALFPDGSEEKLLSIPNFQHNWQMVYRLREPVFLPAGTEIVAEGAFDNSRFNPLNPDPSQEVRWGDQVWDEMFLAWMRIGEAR
ncbi:redoxin domain-containing protein [Pseudohongiella sp.]|uniref:Thioredoxin domain-containing protein n=1 Tax=marine sediment metagenome TaxID=412755 RepID=A0A0F9RGN3_9ZZZZ|nr:redoxin domain-containing protein [Pseudohongiella sp.]